MSAKSKVPDSLPSGGPPTSDESITAELAKLTVDEDNDDENDGIVPVYKEPTPMKVRGIMVKDEKGEYYAPQKGMFAYNPTVFFQVASVRKKLADVIEAEKKKNPSLEVYRFKAIIENFSHPPTKIGGIDRGYMSKFFPKDEESDGERRRKSPRHSDDDD